MYLPITRLSITFVLYLTKIFIRVLHDQSYRKSLQQFALIKKHAKLIAYDEILFKAFENVPIPDEHYIPTLLAWKGLENETTCAGGFAYVRFSVSGVHPRTFGPRDITPELFNQLELEDITTTGKYHILIWSS